MFLFQFTVNNNVNLIDVLWVIAFSDYLGAATMQNVFKKLKDFRSPQRAENEETIMDLDYQT